MKGRKKETFWGKNPNLAGGMKRGKKYGGRFENIKNRSGSTTTDGGSRESKVKGGEDLGEKAQKGKKKGKSQSI